MTHPARGPEGADNPFENFFKDPVYLQFKNNLYNYLRRKDEISRFLKKETAGFCVEIGSGVSPVVPESQWVVYSDPSEQAMKYLKRNGMAQHVLAFSATHMPFKDGSVSRIVCSEVLEHIREDEQVLKEMARILRPGSELILTVPAHRYYFSYDDRFVKHERRYEPAELVERLKKNGFSGFLLSKTAGFIEKVTTLAVVLVFAALRPLLRRKDSGHTFLKFLLPVYKAANRIYAVLVKWEAKVSPFFLTSIVLIHCRKNS